VKYRIWFYKKTKKKKTLVKIEDFKMHHEQHCGTELATARFRMS